MLPVEFYKENRRKLADYMTDNSIYFVHSGEELESTHDESFIFEPYRNFLYLTGIDRAGAILFISKLKGEVKEILFMHIPTEREQRWQNMTWDPGKIKEESGVEEIVDINEWDRRLSRMLFGGLIQDCYIDMARWNMNFPLNAGQRMANRLKEIYPFLAIHNAYAFVCSLRTLKHPAEIAAHRRAVEITEKGVRNMLTHMKPGMYEYEIEAYYDFVLKSSGVRVPAFTTIAACGQNANHMHYVDNNTQTKDGDLILFDLGARWDYYCADVSRTYPVNGKFTNRQAQLYEIVLKGLKVAEDAAKPGAVKDDLQKLSKEVMAEELVKIGKIEKKEDIDKYYMHGSGHLIGLDTHDAGDHDIILRKDVMFTLEPGLYFDDEEIGIRIEDTLLVTEDGCDVFSGTIPKEIEDIE
ncbi:MAG: aminopeptidase P N-terminal domain-containing protein, partial [Parasporobacterium sp.]|nr:aminopeptidase P N-terminal domain-containing protein [Parasporobacterium sp.]